MSTVGWLPAPVEDLFGTEATADVSYDVLTVDVPPASWLTALAVARDQLTCTYFDWLSAVDEPGTGFRVSAHVVALAPVRRLLIRTTVPHEAPALPSAVNLYAGAAWHERETHEMFGVTFEGHPLRKDFVLAARVAKAWPGAKEPGESDHGGPKRRQMLPPGVPDPNEWGPLKGQLPPAPSRPARAAGRTAPDRPARTAADRPPRRTRSASEGSASQMGPEAPTPEAPEAGTPTAGTAPRRARSAAEGSASQAETVAGESSADDAPSTAAPRRTRSAADGSVSQTAAGAGTHSATEGSAPRAEDVTPAAEPATGPAEPATEAAEPATGDAESPTGASEPPAPAAPTAPRRSRSASQGSASQRGTASTDEGAGPRPTPTTPEPKALTAPRSPDAPWHHARPAFDAPAPTRRPAPEPQPREGEGDGQPNPTEAPESPTSEQTGQNTSASQDPTPDTPTPEDPAGGPQ